MAVLIIALFIAIPIILMVGIIAFVLVSTVGQKLKGDIVVNIGNTYFGAGQDIAAVVTVTAKKNLGPGRLIASLVCIEEWYESSTDANGDRSRTRKTKEIYRHDIDLDRSLVLNAGAQQTIPFVLPTPQPQDSVAPDREMPGWERALRAVGDALTPDRDTYWEVRSRYDIQGIDLSTKQRIPLSYEFS